MTSPAVPRQQASPILWFGLLALAGLVILFALATRNDPNIGGEADPDGVGPNGLLAARLFVEEAGGNTQRNVGLPEEDVDVAILAGQGPVLPPFSADDTTVLSWQPLLDWVRNGGTLITTYDLPNAPKGGTAFVDGELGDLLVARGECTDPSLPGLTEVRPLDYIPVEVGADDTSCFGSSEQSLVVIRQFGEGRVVRVGTMALFYNRSLNRADNAALFARLIGIDDAPTVGFVPDPPVWFVLDDEAEIEIDGPGDGDEASGSGDDEPESIFDELLGESPFGDDPPLELDEEGNPIPFDGGGGLGGGGFGGDQPVDEDGNPVGAGDQTLLDLVDPAVLALIAGLTGAAILYAITVGRRHGSPISEEVPIELPSSSYVEATGRLFGKTEDATGRSSAILRHDLRTDLARRVGMASDSSAQDIATALVAGDQQAAIIHMLDGPPPANDDEFVALATQLIETRDRIERSGVATLATSEEFSLVTERTT